MQPLLQEIDFDYYRSALLLVARGEIERLRQEASAVADAEARRKSPVSACPAADEPASPDVVCTSFPHRGPSAVGHE